MNILFYTPSHAYKGRNLPRKYVPHNVQIGFPSLKPPSHAPYLELTHVPLTINNVFSILDNRTCYEITEHRKSGQCY